MANIIAGLGGILVIGLTLLDGFETMVLPRRVSRTVRFARFFFDTSASAWYGVGRRIQDAHRRENFLSFYGPLSLILLLITWAIGLIAGFALVMWALGSPLSTPEKNGTFIADLYWSGTMFFTLGLGDVTPNTLLARLLSVAEAGMGFSFLALIISYLPVLYQNFSSREVRVSTLDEWAGSPSSALELLRRLALQDDLENLEPFLREWELWSAELLESQLSYPVLAFFRSQHTNQSWLSALTTILDTCALVLVGLDDIPPQKTARRTFAMARHAVVDLSQVFGTTPHNPKTDRLAQPECVRLYQELEQVGLPPHGNSAERLVELRRMYEPYANALADKFLMPLPPWIPPPNAHDNWQSTPLGIT